MVIDHYSDRLQPAGTSRHHGNPRQLYEICFLGSFFYYDYDRVARCPSRKKDLPVKKKDLGSKKRAVDLYGEFD